MTMAAWTATHRRIALVAAWLVATALLIACARAVDWTHAVEVLATARPAWLVLAVAANGAILVGWAAFWIALRPASERPVSYGRMFEVASTTSSLMNTMPFGGGHASALVLLIRRGEMTRSGAFSLMALDQLGEGLAKLTIFLLTALLAPLPSWMRAGMMTLSLGIAAWFVVLIVASRWRWEGARQLAILKSWSRSAAALFCVLAIKAAQALAVVAVQHAFGVDLPPGGTLLVLAAIILGSLVLVTPGNLGAFEASVFLAYRHLGLRPEQALSLAIMQHVCFMLPAVGVGYLFVSAHTLSRSAIASR